MSSKESWSQWKEKMSDPWKEKAMEQLNEVAKNEPKKGGFFVSIDPGWKDFGSCAGYVDFSTGAAQLCIYTRSLSNEQLAYGMQGSKVLVNEKSPMEDLLRALDKWVNTRDYDLNACTVLFLEKQPIFHSANGCVTYPSFHLNILQTAIYFRFCSDPSLRPMVCMIHPAELRKNLEIAKGSNNKNKIEAVKFLKEKLRPEDQHKITNSHTADAIVQAWWKLKQMFNITTAEFPIVFV